jgi:hypothetical protein
MKIDDVIEFYDGDTMVASVKSSMVPPVGAKISIRGKTWTVMRVTYALDHADDPQGKGMRANVDLKSAAQAKGGG